MRPLSEEERAWVRAADRLFRRMPPRLLLVESADGVLVVDRILAADVEMCDGGAGRAGIVLATIPHASFKITGVS